MCVKDSLGLLSQPVATVYSQKVLAGLQVYRLRLAE